PAVDAGYPAQDDVAPDGYAPAPPAAAQAPAWGAVSEQGGALAPYAVTPGGTELPSFSEVLGQPAGQEQPAADERTGLFGRLFKRRHGADAAAGSPAAAPLPSAAPAPAASWGAPVDDAWAAPARVDAPAAPASSGFSYRAPQIQHSFGAPETFSPPAAEA